MIGRFGFDGGLEMKIGEKSETRRVKIFYFGGRRMMSSSSSVVVPVVCRHSEKRREV